MERPRDTNGVNHNTKRGSKKYWTDEEDEILLQLVQQQGARNWSSIARHLEGRKEDSCRLRWLNHLNPMINKNPLTKREEEKLFRLHRIYGNKWALIARYFPGRTDNQLKNRYYSQKLSRLSPQISESSQNQHYSTTVSHGSTSTLRHLRGGVDLIYQPQSYLFHLRSGSGESSIPLMLRPSDQSGSGVEDQRVGDDRAERIIHRGERDTQGSSSGLSVADLTPLPEFNSEMTHKNVVFFDFLGVNE